MLRYGIEHKIHNLNRDIGNYVDDVPPPGTIEFCDRDYTLSFRYLSIWCTLSTLKCDNTSCDLKPSENYGTSKHYIFFKEKFLPLYILNIPIYFSRCDMQALTVYIGLAPCHLRFAKIDLTVIRNLSICSYVFY